MEAVHVAVTRQVRPGCEQAFEQALREFARESLREPGTTGVHLIAPVPGTDGCEYGLMRSFVDEEASRRFYETDRFKHWEEQVAPMVVGEPARRRLHGLEAFFRDTKHAPPPRWKMAILTWMGVYPSVLLWSTVMTPPLTKLGVPHLLLVAINNVLVVATLAWVIMPLLTKLFAGWIQGPQQGPTKH